MKKLRQQLTECHPRAVFVNVSILILKVAKAGLKPLFVIKMYKFF